MDLTESLDYSISSTSLRGGDEDKSNHPNEIQMEEIDFGPKSLTLPHPETSILSTDPIQNILGQKLELFRKKKNVADITLTGYLINAIRSKNKMKYEDIIKEVSKSYSSLRRSDGSKYEGDISKTVKACLTSSQIFKELDSDIWTVRENEAREYEEKTTIKMKGKVFNKNKKSKLKDKGQERNQNDMDEDSQNEDEVREEQISKKDNKKSSKRRYKRQKEQYEKVFGILDSCSKALKSNKKTSDYLKNPFRGIKQEESLETIWKRMGGDKFIGIMQCFEYFSPIIQDYLKSKPTKPQKEKVIGTLKIDFDLKKFMLLSDQMKERTQNIDN